MACGTHDNSDWKAGKEEAKSRTNRDCNGDTGGNKHGEENCDMAGKCKRCRFNGNLDGREHGD